MLSGSCDPHGKGLPEESINGATFGADSLVVMNVHCCGVGGDDTNVHVSIFWLAVCPPVPPVNPTYALFPSTRMGIFTGQLFVKDLFTDVSVMVIVRITPS